jgi:hypothetical protein
MAMRPSPIQATPPTFFALKARPSPASSVAVALSAVTRQSTPRSRSATSAAPSAASASPLGSENTPRSAGCQLRRNWTSGCCAAAAKLRIHAAEATATFLRAASLSLE